MPSEILDARTGQIRPCRISSAIPANILAHYEGTGPEIFEPDQTARWTAFVAGMGTTGTLMGVSQYLKQHRSDIRIIGVEPNPGHAIQGLKNMTESIVPTIYDRSRLDDVLPMDDDTAFAMCGELARREGIFAGISGGAAVAAAVRLAKDMTSGTIVTLIPDRGDRYLSDTHFRSVCAECSP